MRHFLLLTCFMFQALPALGMYADDEEIKQWYYNYKRDPQKYRKNLKLLENRANTNELNKPLAQYYLGVLYEEGKSVEENIDKAMKYFYYAACGDNRDAFKSLEEFADIDSQDEPDAQHYLGDLYEKGMGTEKNIGTAMQCYYYAAWGGRTDSLNKLEEYADLDTQNDPDAQYYLGVLYEKGRGVDKDIDRAIECFYDAARSEDEESFNKLKSFADEHDHPSASYYLADIYYKGRGVDENLEKAADYELKAVREVEKYRTDLLEITRKDQDYEKNHKKQRVCVPQQ